MAIYFLLRGFLFYLYSFLVIKKILKTIEWIQSSMYKFKRQILKIRMKTHVSRELLFISESRDRARKYSSPRILLIQLRQFEMNASRQEY